MNSVLLPEIANDSSKAKILYITFLYFGPCSKTALNILLEMLIYNLHFGLSSYVI